MLISMAYAQEVVDSTTVAVGDAAVEGPSTMAFQSLNWGFILLMVVMFYFLLIRPQQKRFKAHQAMVDALKKGDKVVTSGGLIGKIDKLVSETELLIDLGNGTKVSAVRNTISIFTDPAKPVAASKADEKKPTAQKSSGKKAATKK